MGFQRTCTIEVMLPFGKVACGEKESEGCMFLALASFSLPFCSWIFFIPRDEHALKRVSFKIFTQHI
jgi:hypothetical protein